MSVLGGEQFAQQITIALTQAGIKVSGALWNGTARSTSAVLKAIGRALKKVPGIHTEPQGKMSLKKLQRTSGGDLHAQEISPELVRRLKRDLTRRGLDFSMEKGKDGHTYFHFKGADVDTVRHAIAQVAAAIDRHYPDRESPHSVLEPTEIDPAKKIEIEDHPGTTSIDVDAVLDEPGEWTIADDGIVAGETEIVEETVLEWINDTDLAPNVSLESTIPAHMMTYLGRDAQTQARILIGQAADKGWTSSQISQRLSSRPLPPAEKMFNPAKLILARLDDIASTTPPPPGLDRTEKILHSFEGTITPKMIKDRLTSKIEAKVKQHNTRPAPAPVKTRGLNR